MLKNEVKSNTQRVLSNLFELSSSVELFVPSTVNVNVAVDSSDMVDHVQRELSSMFGGATAMLAAGSWVDQTGALVIENVTVVQSYCTTEQLEQHIESVVRLAMHIKTAMSQEAVSLKVNGKLYFV